MQLFFPSKLTDTVTSMGPDLVKNPILQQLPHLLVHLMVQILLERILRLILSCAPLPSLS